MLIILRRAAHRHLIGGLLLATRVGTFTQALYDEAKKQGWTVISIKNDWKRISLSSNNGLLLAIGP